MSIKVVSVALVFFYRRTIC